MTFEHCGFAREIRAITRLCRWMRLSCGFRAANRGCIGNFDLREEAVAAASNGFHKAGTLRGVAKGLTDFADRLVEPVGRNPRKCPRARVFSEVPRELRPRRGAQAASPGLSDSPYERRCGAKFTANGRCERMKACLRIIRVR